MNRSEWGTVVGARPAGGVRVRAALWRLAAVVGFVGLLTAGAHLKLILPGSPVPVTLQTMAVLLAGAVLGPLDAVAAVVLYVLAGAFVLPAFALSTGPSGLAYFAGVTGGYLAGFAVAAILVGLAARRTRRSYLAMAAAMFVGSLAILSLGTLYLSILLHLPAAKALAVGFMPFVVGDAVKTAAAFGLWAFFRWEWRGGA